jgi:hypothetical protein
LLADHSAKANHTLTIRARVLETFIAKNGLAVPSAADMKERIDTQLAKPERFAIDPLTLLDENDLAAPTRGDKALREKKMPNDEPEDAPNSERLQAGCLVSDVCM